MLRSVLPIAMTRTAANATSMAIDRTGIKKTETGGRSSRYRSAVTTASVMLRQVRRSGAIIVLASGALYIAMKGRVAWYGLMQWALNDAMQPVGKVVLAIASSRRRGPRA
jgi:hypothetical protein